MMEDVNVNKADLLKGDHKMSKKDMLRRVGKYLKPETLRFVFASIIIVINVAFDIIFPLFVKNITDNLQSSNINLTYLIILAISYFVLCVVNQFLLYIESIVLQKAGQNIVYNLRMEVFEHVERMTQNQLNEMPVGSLVTRVASYTSAMSDLFTNTIVNLVRNILTVIGVYIAMFIISPRLSLILLSIVAVVFLISFFFERIISSIYREERKDVSDLNTFLNENLSGMKTTQMFNQQNRKLREFCLKNVKLRKTRYKIVIAFSLYRPLINFLYYGAVAITFVVGSRLGLTGGEIVGFYLYLSKFFNPIQNIADQLNNISKALSASEKLFNLLDVKPDVLNTSDAIEIEHFEGKIEFKNVWFAYTDDQWILKDVSFVINPRETCAFVGATGAGKTTILGLIVRNYEIQKGQILIDDVDIKNIKIDCLRRAIGQMLQDVFLFSGSIRTNITLHDDSYTDKEILDTCKYVNADAFINKLEHGLDEEVIERGENFSQGQRQLLSFARTVLAKPQILILDEATANIDTETEVLIQESLEKIKNIGTMLVVAHRLSTIQKADQIIVLQHGEIIEKGTHQELLKQKGYYYKLYLLQFVHKQ